MQLQKKNGIKYEKEKTPTNERAVPCRNVIFEFVIFGHKSNKTNTI